MVRKRQFGRKPVANTPCQHANIGHCYSCPASITPKPTNEFDRLFDAGAISWKGDVVAA